MAVTNNNKKQVDLPVWELLNQAPVASQAISCTTQTLKTGRYIYYITGATFYRYDTQADSWQLLNAPATTPTVATSMTYSSEDGFHTKIISATSTSITIGGLPSPILNGVTVSIDRGLGQGQSRTLTYSSSTTHDAWVITSTTVNTIIDSTKKWKPNQWAWYMVWLNFGTASPQYKKILYNDATTLTISDGNILPQEVWGNQTFTSALPFASQPSTVAGAQSHYEIISTTYTVPAWTTTPNYTSYANVKSGAVYLMGGISPSPFYMLQVYDVAHNMWSTRTVPAALITSMWPDVSIHAVEKKTAYITSTATSWTTRTLADTLQSMTVDRYKNSIIVITGGTGIGQLRRIVSNTATTFYTEKNWDTTPDATSTYEIHNDYNKIWFSTSNLASTLAYNTENDFWMQWETFDFGVTNNISVKYTWQEPFWVSTGVRIASWVTAVSSSPTAWGTGYSIGDILTCAVGGAGAQVIVTSISPWGIVTGIELTHSGTTTGYTTGSGKATTGGTGSGCTINITSVGATALITTATAHFYKTGDVVTFAGCTEAAYNTAHTILGVNATNSFSVAVTAVASMVATASQGVTTIVDPTKNWVINEHAWKLVHLMVAWLTPTSQMRWIISNTATTLTVATITSWVNGQSKYVIYDSKIFGVDNQKKPANECGSGHASGGSTTTLVDDSKNWLPNQWVNYRFRIDAGTGLGSWLITITSNTATTLTYATQTFTPDSTTAFEIQDTWGLLTASTTTSYTDWTTKAWGTNQWAGKRLKLTGGLGQGTEVSVISNTGTVLTTAASTAWDATTPYAIIGTTVRGNGTAIIHIDWTTDATNNGAYLISMRWGLTNVFDIFDIRRSKWIYGGILSPNAEIPWAGSYMVYDGEDTIYFTKTLLAANPRIFAYNVKTGIVTGAGQISDLDWTLVVGNRMSIIETEDGLQYLYYLQNTWTKLYRALLWYAQ